LDTLSLNPYSRHLEPVIDHIDADTVFVGRVRRWLPSAMQVHNRWSWQKQASREPVRFIFLAAIMSPEKKLHVFGHINACGGMRKKKMSEFVHQIACLPRRRMRAIHDNDRSRALTQAHCGPAIRIIEQKTLQTLRRKARYVIRKADDNAHMLRQSVRV